MIVQKLLKHITNFVYPPLCLHCQEILSESHKSLCNQCISQLILIDPEQRCKGCFSLLEEEKKRCKDCLQAFPSWTVAAAALDYEGPAVSLISQMKYANQPYLAEGAAGFLAAQFLALEWPLPDFLVPVPISLTRWFQRGYNQSAYLAKHLGKILDRPVYSLLKRKSGGYSQAGLSSNERKELSLNLFSVPDNPLIENSSILLIDDVMTTGSTLDRCTEALLNHFPREIRVLTLCRAVAG